MVSPNASSFWGTSKFAQNVMAIHLIVVETFQSEPKWWTDRPDIPKVILLPWVKSANNLEKLTAAEVENQLSRGLLR